MKHVRFLVPVGPYRIGDVASFDDRQASKLLDSENPIVEEVELASTKLDNPYEGQQTTASAGTAGQTRNAKNR